MTPGVRDRYDPTADEDPIAALIEREHRLREELAGIRPALERMVIEQALAVRDDEERRDRLVRRLYWEVPSIPVTVLRVAFGVPGRSARSRDRARRWGGAPTAGPSCARATAGS